MSLTRKAVVLVAAASMVPAAVAVGFFVTSPVGQVAMLLAAGEDGASGAIPTNGVCTVTVNGRDLSLTSPQLTNSAGIVKVANEVGAGNQGATVALATSMQEAKLLRLASRANPDSLNYPHDDVAKGDHDSVGPFQQRDAWGPMADRMAVEPSATMFFKGGKGGQRGLLAVPGWRDMRVGQAAQAVQVSAFPDAYAQWEPLARALVAGSNVTCDAGGGTVPAGEWAMPLAKGSYRITSPYGPRPCNGCSKFHGGVDLGAPEGTPIYAAAAGRVIWSGMYPSGSGGMETYGNLIVIDHGGGVTTMYAHQSKLIAQRDAVVAGGQQIGAVGNTGRSFGAHLHLETRIDGTRVDPVQFLRSKGVTL